MGTRFIHTADWQIGKPFRQFGDKEAVLQEARLDAIRTIGELAMREGAAHVLVAGDVYDSDAPKPKTLHQPLERMKRLDRVQWHLIPGNHDPHRAQGLWDRAREDGLPDNVHLHLESRPVKIEPGVALLPAPLLRRSETTDLTAWMDEARTSPDLIRIGLAHGSVTDFGNEGEAGNPIAPDRPRLARLDYLALGDWHRTVRIGPACWYAGTPEPDRPASQENGTALLVEIDGPGAPARVTEHRVGRFRWLTRHERLDAGGALDDLLTRLGALPDADRTVLRLRLGGVLALAERAGLDNRLERLAAGLFHLRTDLTDLGVRPDVEDLESIDLSGVLRQVAEKLRGLATDPARTDIERRTAEDALVELFLRRRR